MKQAGAAKKAEHTFIGVARQTDNTTRPPLLGPSFVPRIDWGAERETELLRPLDCLQTKRQGETRDVDWITTQVSSTPTDINKAIDRFALDSICSGVKNLQWGIS